MDHRNDSPVPHQPDKLYLSILQGFYELFATTPTRHDDDSRLIGVSSLTGIILEERVALEACRTETSTEHALHNLKMFA